jgi:hypothetical protein
VGCDEGADGEMEGCKVGLVGVALDSSEGATEGWIVGAAIGSGKITTTPPPRLRSTPVPIITSSNPSPLMSPTPLTTTPPPVITTPCEAVMPITLLTVIVLLP